MSNNVVPRASLAAASITFALAVLGAGQSVLLAQDVPGGVTNVAVAAEGRKVYTQICQACHMADAKGGKGAGAKIPALAGNPKLANKDFVISQMIKGKGAMPPLAEILTPKQMAAVATYVRSHFNKYPDVVTEANVKRIAGASSASPRDCSTC